MSKTLELAQQREQLPFAEAHGAERKRIAIIGADLPGWQRRGCFESAMPR